MKSYEDFLKEREKKDTPKKDEYVELGIGNRDHTRKDNTKKDDDHIELGIGDR